MNESLNCLSDINWNNFNVTQTWNEIDENRFRKSVSFEHGPQMINLGNKTDCVKVTSYTGQPDVIHQRLTNIWSNTGCPKNNGTVNFQDFALINSYLFSPCWIEHLFLLIITPRSLNLVKKFLFYEYFLMDCHFRALPLSFHWWVAPKRME